MDYTETFAPVVRAESLRALLALAVQRKMAIHQMDVQTAYLNGDLEEEIYMEQPPGYVQKGSERLVCRLKKSLYGLKQVGRCWNKKLVHFLKERGFVQSVCDPSVFYKLEPLTLLTIYVDDLILLTGSEEEMSELKEVLASGFKMTDQGKLHYILGIEAESRNGVLKLSQRKYVEQILEKFGQAQANVLSTPADPSVVLRKEDGSSKPVNPTFYQAIVGSLLYLALQTRPDIQYAVGSCARFCASPNESHLTAAKRIMRYLKGTQEYGIVFRPEKEPLIGYADADYAGDVDDRKSTSGYIFQFGGSSPVSWYSGKQKCVSTSTSCAEYIALGAAAREAIYLQHLFEELGVTHKPVTIFEDNQSTIAMVKNPVHHSRQKHIEVQAHFIRDEQEKGTISVIYCPTGRMNADVFTKALPRVAFTESLHRLGILGGEAWWEI